jgi:hypothetical protein
MTIMLIGNKSDLSVSTTALCSSTTCSSPMQAVAALT